MNKRQTGSQYEEKAAEYMKQHGYQILERNYRCRQGEIDIIAQDGDYLVFVEVKYRGSTEKGYPAEAVTERKQRTIRQVAAYYLYSRRLSEQTPVRFDVAAILGEEIQYIKNAF